MFGRKATKGIALVAVLWALTLLSVIAAGFLNETRTESYLARNAVENARARALAEAGINRAVQGLFTRDLARRWRPDGTIYVWPFDGGVVEITIEDEKGKIDLNNASVQILERLFTTVGLESDEASALAGAIADYRDPDDLREVNGAEDRDYQAAGYPYEAKDAPFEMLSELRQVFGMTAGIYELVVPGLTVHGGPGRVNLETAPPLVMAALSEVDTTQTGLAPPQEPLRVVVGAEGEEDTRPFVRSRVRVATIRAKARTAAGAVFLRQAVIRLGGRGAMPFRYVDWEQGFTEAEPVSDVDLDAEDE